MKSLYSPFLQRSGAKRFGTYFGQKSPYDADELAVKSLNFLKLHL